MTSQSHIQNIRHLIAEDDVTGAIARLKELLEHTPLLNEVLQQSGRFENILKQVRLGTVKPAEATLTLNQIRVALLDLVSEIEEQNKPGKLHQEIERAVSVVNAKNVLVDSSINARTVSIGDRTEVHHHYTGERTGQTVGLKIGGAMVVVIGVLAGLAGFTGFSLKDLWNYENQPVITPAQDNTQIKPEPPTDRPAAPEPQGSKQPSSKKKSVTGPRNHFESHDSSKQINIPDNQGVININQ